MRARKFDWDEARRLRADGWTYRAIADHLGVSLSAVNQACDDRARAVNRMRKAEWQRGGRCQDCGCQISRNASRPARRCLACANAARRTSVRDDGHLRCSTCREWKEPAAFPHDWNSRAEARGFRRHLCTACDTLAKRAWRQRQRARTDGEPVRLEGR